MTAPIRREIVVNAAPGRAFDLFTGRIGAWWPLERFGVYGDGTVAFEGRLLIERSGDREAIWGEVLEWNPPSGLAVTWHPGYGSENATQLRITFTEQDQQTLVTLVHTGWENMDNPDAAASEYGNGWPGVLERYRELVDEVTG